MGCCPFLVGVSAVVYLLFAVAPIICWEIFSLRSLFCFAVLCEFLRVFEKDVGPALFPACDIADGMYLGKVSETVCRNISLTEEILQLF